MAGNQIASETFVPRTTKPEAGNKYYIRKVDGGYSDAIKGKPTDPDCNVLSNCVGYAYGRFNEIGGYGKCKYLCPTNAENFMQYKGDLKVGQAPKLGACMVWQKGASLSGTDGAGHVAIVEKIVSPTEIVTSESGWNSKAFWTQVRKKGNGNWGQGNAYEFLGFIYNPAVSDDAEPEKPISVTGTASTGSAADEKTIWDFLMKHIGNPFGVAGLMGNLFAESGLRSNNLQSSGEKKLGYTDETYTAAVDGGTYENFVKDSAGYGLAQWTYWTRKQKLLDYHRAAGKSIGDLETQLAFLMKELQESYKVVWEALRDATSIMDASNCVLMKYEKPSDQGIAVQKKRTDYGQKYYDKYAEKPKEPERHDALEVDGIWGAATTRRLQEIFGTPVDGEVSNQNIAYKTGNPGLASGWEWVAKAKASGSALIRAMQKWADMPKSAQDGKIGPKTIRAFQKKLGVSVDGNVSKPSAMVKALQAWANQQ